MPVQVRDATIALLCCFDGEYDDDRNGFWETDSLKNSSFRLRFEDAETGVENMFRVTVEPWHD